LNAINDADSGSSVALTRYRYGSVDLSTAKNRRDEAAVLGDTAGRCGLAWMVVNMLPPPADKFWRACIAA